MQDSGERLEYGARRITDGRFVITQVTNGFIIDHYPALGGHDQIKISFADAVMLKKILNYLIPGGI